MKQHNSEYQTTRTREAVRERQQDFAIEGILVVQNYEEKDSFAVGVIGESRSGGTIEDKGSVKPLVDWMALTGTRFEW
jgi:hypothetical protein